MLVVNSHIHKGSSLCHDSQGLSFWLPQKHHLPGQRMSLGGQLMEIDAGGDSKGLPDDGVRFHLLNRLQKAGSSPPREVKYLQLDRGRCRHMQHPHQDPPPRSLRGAGFPEAGSQVPPPEKDCLRSSGTRWPSCLGWCVR